MRFHTLDDWLHWQETLHPNEIELGLDRVRTVLECMGLAQPNFTTIIVAGTNGKGSSVAMLESILRAAGHRVGSYSSPHLLRYNERIRIDGEEIDDASLCEAFERVDRARGDLSLTYFEFGTLAAIDLLQRAGIAIAVLEVGLGGRLDAVNVLDADLALITPIDVDHVQWLGVDREMIGGEKAGIMRFGRPVVCSDPRPPQSLLDKAKELLAPLYCVNSAFSFESEGLQWYWQAGEASHDALPLPALRGDFQLANAAGVLMVLALLNERFPVARQALCSGLLDVRLPGRFQVLPGSPTQIFDVAHNPHSARALAQNLSQQPCHGRTLAVLAMLGDKDIQATVACLQGQVDIWFLADLHVSRGVTAEHLSAVLDGVNECFESVSLAYTAALTVADPDDRVVVFGSFYTVAVVLGI